MLLQYLVRIMIPVVDISSELVSTIEIPSLWDDALKSYANMSFLCLSS